MGNEYRQKVAYAVAGEMRFILLVDKCLPGK